MVVSHAQLVVQPALLLTFVQPALKLVSVWGKDDAHQLAEMDCWSLVSLVMTEIASMAMVARLLAWSKPFTLVKVVRAFADTMDLQFAEMAESKAVKRAMMETRLTVMDVHQDAKSNLQWANSATLQLKEMLTQTLTTCLWCYEHRKSIHSLTKTKWRTSWRQVSQTQHRFLQCTVRRETNQIWTCTIVWRFTVQEFQTGSSRWCFRSITMGRRASLKWKWTH